MLFKKTKPSVESFVEETANDIIKKLGEDDKKYLLENSDYIPHHFGFGLWIRNTYIHGQELPLEYGDPDDLSGEIFDEVIRILRGEN